MKKLLSLVLVLAVVLSSMSFAFAAAPSDTAGNKYESSILKLMSLGIVNGYTDGTFKPDSNITRAEFAKLMCVALGYQEAAAAAKNNVVFSDVKADHWASGYIAVAYQNELIKGVGNGKFDPEANVTYEQVVTIIMRSLGKGYDKMADTMGGYPVGYLSIASQKEVTKDCDGTPGTAANRALVAKVIDNALDKPWMNMSASKITSDGKVEYTFETSTDNMLLKGLHLKKYTAIVDSVDTTNSKITFESDVDGKKVYDAVSPISVVGLAKCKVEVWEKDGKVYSLDNKTTVKFDKLDKINGTDSRTSADVLNLGRTSLNKVTLKNDGGTYYAYDSDTSNAATDVTITTNFEDWGDVAAVDDLDELIGYYAKVYVDSDNKVYRIEAFDLSNTRGVISAADAATVTYQGFDANDMKIRDLDKTDDLVVAIDGVQKTAADLKADMFFRSFVSSNGKKVFITASTKKAEGKLDAYKDDKAKIAGTYIDLAANNNTDVKFISYNNGTKFEKDDLVDLGGLNVVAYLDEVGKIGMIKGTATSTTTDFIAMVKKVKVEGESITVLKDVDGKSTEVDYPVKTSDVNDAVTNGTDANDISWSTFTGNVFNVATTGNVDAQNASEIVYKFFVNSAGQIKEIRNLTWDYDSGSLYTPTDFNKDNDFINGTALYYVDSAKFFNMTDTAQNASTYDLKALYWKDIEGKAVGSSRLAIARDGSNTSKAAAVVFVQNYDTLPAGDKYYGLVTSEERNGDYYDITLAAADGTKNLKIHKDDADDDSDFQSGENAMIVYEMKGSAENQVDIIDMRYVTPTTTGGAVYLAQAGTKYFNGVILNDTQIDGSDATVLEKDGSNIRIGNKGDVGTWYTLASNAVYGKVALKNSDTEVDTVTPVGLGDVQVGDKVAAFRNVDDGKIRLLYFVR